MFLKVEGDAMTSLCQSLSNINAKRQGVRRTGGRQGEKGGQGEKGRGVGGGRVACMSAEAASVWMKMKGHGCLNGRI